VFFQQASTAAKTSTMVRQFSATLAEARVLIKGTPFTDVPTSINSYLIAAGAVPPDMVKSATELSNPFGGDTAFSAAMIDNSTVMHVFLTNVPQGVCTRLLTATTSGIEWDYSPATIAQTGATTIVSPGYFWGAVVAPGGTIFPRTYHMNATQAGWMCKYGSEAYGTKTSEPSSATPISGNVNMWIVFAVDR